MPLGLTPAHLILILVIALIVVGPGRLPEVGQALGKTIKEFKKAAVDVQEATTLGAATAPATAPAAAPAAAPVQAPPAPTQAAPVAPAVAAVAAPVLEPPAAPVIMPAAPAEPEPAQPVVAAAAEASPSTEAGA